MKYILVVALLLPSFLWAQEKVKNKNSIQIIKGMGMGHHFFGESPEVDQTFYYLGNLESSKPGLNYRFGIDYQRQIIGGLSVKVGNRFSMWSINDIVIEPIGCWVGYLPQEPKKLRNFYIEMPFALQYKFGKDKLQFYVEVGANPMFRILNDDNNVEPFSLAMQVGTGLSYQISSNCSIFGQLSSRVQTNETFLDVNYGHLYDIGIELGVGFDF